jgi:hypothetical protein
VARLSRSPAATSTPPRGSCFGDGSRRRYLTATFAVTSNAVTAVIFYRTITATYNGLAKRPHLRSIHPLLWLPLR